MSSQREPGMESHQEQAWGMGPGAGMGTGCGKRLGKSQRVKNKPLSLINYSCGNGKGVLGTSGTWNGWQGWEVTTRAMTTTLMTTRPSE